MEAYFHPAARDELDELPVAEQRAIDHAIEKLEALGAQLPFPHASKVQGAATLFELHLGVGAVGGVRSYRQVGEHMVIAAIGPEAQVDSHGFARAVKAAQERLATL